MHRFLTGCIVGAVIIAPFWITKATAEEYLDPPPSGLFLSFEHEFVVCDTKEQVEDIAKLGVKEYAPMQAKLLELYALADSHGEHTCVLAPVEDIVTGENEEIGFIVDAKGIKSKAWALHVGNMHGEWWLLYAVHPKRPPGTDT